MPKVIEFYIPKNFRKVLRTATQTAIRKNNRVLPTDEEISLTVRKAVEV
jgi:hypothetical protein